MKKYNILFLLLIFSILIPNSPIKKIEIHSLTQYDEDKNIIYANTKKTTTEFDNNGNILRYTEFHKKSPLENAKFTSINSYKTISDKKAFFIMFVGSIFGILSYIYKEKIKKVYNYILNYFN